MHTTSFSPLHLITALSLALGSSYAFADSWTVTQNTTASNGVGVVLQTGTSGGAVQAVNSVNLNSTDGTVNDTSTQTFNNGDNPPTLRQNSGTTASSQAFNRVYAHTINGVVQNVVLGGLNTLKLDQTSAIGSNNTQAVNETSTPTINTAKINKLTQKVDDSSNIMLLLAQSGGTGNIQAANLIQSGNLSTTADAVTQLINVNTANILQANTTKSIQAGNALIMLADATGGALKQTFTANSTGVTRFEQATATNSIQALNYAGVAIP
jgi:hypothetical protein